MVDLVLGSMVWLYPGCVVDSYVWKYTTSNYQYVECAKVCKQLAILIHRAEFIVSFLVPCLPMISSYRVICSDFHIEVSHEYRRVLLLKFVEHCLQYVVKISFASSSFSFVGA